MANLSSFPFKRSVNIAGARRISYIDKDASAAVDSLVFPMAVYVGALGRSNRYIGQRINTDIYLGRLKLFL